MLTKNRARFWTAYADVEYGEQENEDGIDVPCVYVTCQRSGETVGPIWGDGDASVKRALATLSGECSCGAPFHRTPPPG